MDETPVLANMVSDAIVDTAGTNTVTVKSTVMKILRFCASSCL